MASPISALYSAALLYQEKSKCNSDVFITSNNDYENGLKTEIFKYLSTPYASDLPSLRQELKGLAEGNHIILDQSTLGKVSQYGKEYFSIFTDIAFISSDSQI